MNRKKYAGQQYCSFQLPYFAQKRLYVGEFASIVTTLWNFLQSANSKKNSCCENYLRKYGIPIVADVINSSLVFMLLLFTPMHLQFLTLPIEKWGGQNGEVIYGWPIRLKKEGVLLESSVIGKMRMSLAKDSSFCCLYI